MDRRQCIDFTEVNDMERERFVPRYRKGDLALAKDFTGPGWLCHATAEYGDPMGIPSTLRRLGRQTDAEWTCKGYTADQIEEDLAIWKAEEERRQGHDRPTEI